MSQHLENISEDVKSSHVQSEYNSKTETKLEEGTTTSKEDTFLSIQYPAPFLCKWDFINSVRVKQYIMKHFHIEMIRRGLHSYPDLLRDVIYYSTYIISTLSNIILIHQFMNAMPAFKNGQKLLPDTLILVI